VPSPPKSQPFSDFPEPNVHLFKAHRKPPSQYPEHVLPTLLRKLFAVARQR
jgi:hypothetical protein